MTHFKQPRRNIQRGAALPDSFRGGGNPIASCHTMSGQSVKGAPVQTQGGSFIPCPERALGASPRRSPLPRYRIVPAPRSWERLQHRSEPRSVVPQPGGGRVREEDVENGTCSSDGRVREPLDPQGTSATDHVLRRLLRGFLGQRSSHHPVLTLLLLLLLFLLLAVVAALAVRSAPQVPAPPAAPTLVLGCPPGWVGYNGVCYYFSRDSRTWEQSQERCSELGASLAIVQDEAMHWLLRLRGNVDYWLGLRRRGERLRWGDGSSFSSSVPVLGSEECVCLAEEKFRSESCSNRRPYLCSKAQAPL
ncbi:C-type lectin domain family 2 member L-like [Cinclus cinclus]|uniref:C-type lectin domain family 2 member L-like n=1 Tax=Cinclus cinclus TaxID=127875 RepID=UPI002E1348AE